MAKPVLLFDGVCNLCNASVQWVLLRDKFGIFQFAALQSETGQALLTTLGLEKVHFDSVVLIDGDQFFLRSDVPIEVGKRLGGLYRLAILGKLVPKFIRDKLYNWIARNRYRWWGRKESCMLPKPEWKERFL